MSDPKQPERPQPTMVKLCPVCLSRNCASLGDPEVVCPEVAVQNLARYFLELLTQPNGASALARQLAQVVVRLDALEAAFVKR